MRCPKSTLCSATADFSGCQVLSPAVSSCAVVPRLHDCSVRNLLRAAIPRLAVRNCSRLSHCLSSVSLGTHDGGDHLHKADSEEAAYTAPRYDQGAGNSSIL
jgi:hypothetical protein